MILSYRNNYADRAMFSAHQIFHSPIVILMNIGFLLLITFQITLPVVRDLPDDPTMFARVFTFVILEIMLVCLIIAGWAVIILVTSISRMNKPTYCEKRITLSDDGFSSESEYGKSETRWTLVQKLARTRRHIFLYLAQANAIVIPRRAFQSPVEWNAFYDYCKQRAGRPNPVSKSI